MIKYKSRSLFNNELNKLFDDISYCKKYFVAGSGNIKNIEYPSDYDLIETIEIKNINEIKNLVVDFRKMGEDIKRNEKIFFIEFKTGLDYNDNKLRWNNIELISGRKEVDGRVYDLQYALKQRILPKLDIIYHLSPGVFIEVSIIYELKIKDVYVNEDHLKPEEITESIMTDYFDFKKEKYYLKALKRMFSILKMNETKNEKSLKLLLSLFNSNIGLINFINSNLKLYIELLEKFKGDKRISIEEFKSGLQNDKMKLNTIYEFGFSEKFIKCLMMSVELWIILNL